jgi:outer membrane protein assembly factor BamB
MNAARQCRLELCAYRLALGLLLCLLLSATAADWPQFRGPTHDAISTERLNKQWTGSVTNPVWRVPLTNCLGSVAVSGGRVFTQMVRNIGGTEKELCVALNATNGTMLWATPVDKAQYDGGVGFDDGPRTTPAVEGNSVFVLTSYMQLYRLNVTNGAIIWRRDLVNEYGSQIIEYENCASPVIENGLIYLNVNCGSATLKAMDISDGGVAWNAMDEDLTHSTPTLATIQAVRQIIFATQSGLVALDSRTGSWLWQVQYPFTYSLSVGVSPVVYQDMVFVGGAHAYGMGSMCVRATRSLGTWTATLLWSTNNPASHWMTPVARDGFLYGQFGIQSFDSPNAQLKCVEMRTGAVKWSVNGFGRGATILWDDHLVSLTEQGQLVLVKPSTNAYTELARFTAIPDYHDYTNKCWNGPAVADGRLFVRSTTFLASFDLSVPPLTISSPQFSGSNNFNLSIRTANGAAVSSERLTNLEVRSTASLGLAVTQWNRLTNSLVLTNGVVRLQNVGTGTETQRFFIVSEPK